MKTALRKGDEKSLNIYYIPGLTVNLNGTWGYSETSTDWEHKFQVHDKEFLRVMDGVIVDANTMPGSADEWTLHPDGTAYCYSCLNRAGKVTTHEVGHWMGLMHPFEGGCEEKYGGDLVLDTPPQATPGPEDQTCAHPVNTCPGKKGLDSVYPLTQLSDTVSRC